MPADPTDEIHPVPNMALPVSGMNRRRLLQLSALSGTALLGGLGLAACGSSEGTAAPLPVLSPEPHVALPPTGPTANPATGVTFFSQEDLEFEVLFAFGATAYGAGEAGEIIATVNQIQAAGPNYQTYYDNFIDRGSQIAALGDEALKAGRSASARSAYLRAAQYFDQALFFVLGTSTPSAEATVYQAMQRQWNLAAQLMDIPFERVAIPYGNTTMPGYFLRPSTSNTRRPTVIINNGSDAQNLDTYAWGGAAALERGYNALLFEGPGQGSMLFERRIPFRPDWEKVITPIVDWLHQRSDVDTSRIALTGWSFGGELVARAAAHEHRLAAVCSDPGMLSAWLGWSEEVRSLFTSTATEEQVNTTWNQEYIPVIDQDPITKFTLAKRSEIYGTAYMDAARAGQVFTDVWALGHNIMQYSLYGDLDQISVPYLVMQYELDLTIPATQTQQVYDGLASKHKEYMTMTVADGGEYHCGPMAPQRRNQIVFDWLDSTMDV